MKRTQAFTIVELIFSMAIMSIFMLAIGFSVSKKDMKQIDAPIGGRLICYKDANNVLHQKSEIIYEDTTRVTEGAAADRCLFDLPASVDKFNVDIIGGGGGGSSGAPANVGDNTTSATILEPFSPSSLQMGTRAVCQMEAGTPIYSQYDEYGDISLYTTLSNNLSAHMDDITYTKNFLNDIGVVSVGGSGLNGTAGAQCALTRDFSVGQSVLLYEGLAEIEESIGTYAGDKRYSSSTAGGLMVNGSNVLAAPGFVSRSYGSISVPASFSSSPSCVGGTESAGETTSVVVYAGRPYSIRKVNNIYLRPGQSGVPGESINLPDKPQDVISDDGKVTILAADIGNGGLFGENGNPGSTGGKTVFKLGTAVIGSANGGAGGASPIDNPCAVQDSKIENNEIESRSHPGFTCQITTPVRGEVAEYVKNKIFPAISLNQQESYYSQSGACVPSGGSFICSDATGSSEVSYGRAGSAGTSAVRYDKIVQFSYTGTAGTKSTPLHEPQLFTTKAASGSGGAIIISW